MLVSPLRLNQTINQEQTYLHGDNQTKLTHDNNLTLCNLHKKNEPFKISLNKKKKNKTREYMILQIILTNKYLNE